MAEAHREPGATMGAGDPPPPPEPPAAREDFIADQRRHRVAARGYALHRMGALPHGASAAPAVRPAAIGANVLFGILAAPLVVALLLTVCALVYTCVLLGLLVVGLFIVVTVLPAHVLLRGL